MTLSSAINHGVFTLDEDRSMRHSGPITSDSVILFDVRGSNHTANRRSGLSRANSAGSCASWGNGSFGGGSVSSFHNQDPDDVSSHASFRSMQLPMQFESPCASPASWVSNGSARRLNNDNRRMTLDRIKEIAGNEDILSCPIEEELFGNNDSFSMNKHRMGTRKDHRFSKLSVMRAPSNTGSSTRGPNGGRMRNHLTGPFRHDSTLDSDCESLTLNLSVADLDLSNRSNTSALDSSIRSNASSLDGSIRVEDLAHTRPTAVKISHSRPPRALSPPRHLLAGGSFSSNSIGLSSYDDSNSQMSTLQDHTLLEQDSLHLLRKNKAGMVGRRRQFARTGRSSSTSNQSFQSRTPLNDASRHGGDDRSSGGTTISSGSQPIPLSVPRTSNHESRRSLFSSFHSLSTPSIRTGHESFDASLASFGAEVKL